MHREDKGARGPEEAGRGAYGLDLTDQDIYDAMKDIHGYLDITPGDLKEVYRHAYEHAYIRLTGRVKAKDIMTGNVISVSPDSSLQEVAAAMARHGLSGFPVIEGESLGGFVSEQDLLSCFGMDTLSSLLVDYLSGRGCAAPYLGKTETRKVMTSPVITVREDTPVVEIASILGAKRIRRVPVVDRSGKMVGIVSKGDTLKAFSGVVR